jgi:Lon protease-like protein
MDDAPLLSLFPLRLVLFPGGHLPLRIFEPRYLDLVTRCQRSGEPFGVVALIEGDEVRRRDVTAPDGAFVRESFHPIGTLARIESFETLQTGLLQIRCRGDRRFRLSDSRQLPHGLWMGRPEWLDDDAPVPVPPDLLPLVSLLQGLLHTLEQGAAAADLPVQPPYLWDDSGWLANRWCELLPLPADERQRLMQLDNPLLRLELVADQLERLGVR